MFLSQKPKGFMFLDTPWPFTGPESPEQKLRNLILGRLYFERLGLN